VRIAIILGFGSVALLAAGTFCGAEPLVIGGDFINRIPADGTGEEFMEDAVLTVPQHAFVTDLDVYLDITHENVIDLIITLYSPNGQFLVLKDDALMNLFWQEDPRENMYGTVFDDEAVLTLPEGQPPYFDRFQPAEDQYLSVFDGRDAYGDWTLEIYDLAYGDIGALDRWELRFDVTHTPEPSSLGCIGLLAICALRRKRRRTVSPF
jgi:hypothetical protein